jgi:UDP-N-acetylmuramoylalanine--D-glutamate ligase
VSKIISKTFEFTKYTLEPEKARVVFDYAITFSNREAMSFSETIYFPKAFSVENIPAALLENILISMHLILGISYYKLYCPPRIKTAFVLSKEQADFWNVVYHKGLGEFFYCNKIDSRNLIKFPFRKNTNPSQQRLERKNRTLVGIGGGKDSIVAAELLLEHGDDITAMLVETQKKDPISASVIEKMKIGSLIISRQLDAKILTPIDGSYNGHVPISAIFAFLGYLTAVIYDYSRVIVANEYSSNFGNIEYLGEEVNHQWSKSAEFEKLFQSYTRKFICPDITYFSLLRPYYEIRIVELFSKYKKYFSTFTSCNRNFRVQKERPGTLWCSECPKCLFVWTLLSAFLSRDELVKMFGRDLYADEKLLSGFGDILGYGKTKPFDCVGTFDEARAALFLAKDKFSDSVIVKNFIGKIKNPEKLVDRVMAKNSAPTLPAKFKLYGTKNVLILGYGKEGEMSEKYLRKYFPEIKIDIADKVQDKNYLKKQRGHDLAVKTPGIQKEQMIIPYVTATSLFFSQVKNTIIGVTGSKGKSTTASLIYSVLKAAGKKVRLVGNIGSPMLQVLLEPINEDEIFVVELSSYQLDDLEYSPQIAVVTNLFPEHMDFHGNALKYYAAKKNIINFQNTGDTFLFSGKNKELKKWAKEIGGVDFSKIDLGKINVSLLGAHNRENAKAAIAVAIMLGISENAIKKGIENFRGLPHRLELVGEFKEIKFYDDAISTTPESAIAAILALPDTDTIFLGGLNRGYDFSQLAVTINRSKIRNIVFFPDSGEEIEKVLSQKSRKKYLTLHTKDMKEAVSFAFAKTKTGKICLLSTASPSYSVWKSFEEKGDKFKEAVKSWTMR